MVKRRGQGGQLADLFQAQSPELPEMYANGGANRLASIPPPPFPPPQFTA